MQGLIGSREVVGCGTILTQGLSPLVSRAGREGGRHILRCITDFLAHPTLIGDHDDGSVEDLENIARTVLPL